MISVVSIRVAFSLGVTFAAILLVPSGASDADTDYYWKDYYNGHVPLDAIPGGFDSNGKRTFVAALAHPNIAGELLPGNLYPGSYAVAQADNIIPVLKQDKFVRVLCSKHHQRYKWEKINIADFDKLTGTPVRGGFKSDTYIYVGRAAIGDEIIVGKVIPLGIPNGGLWLPDGRTYKYLADFEILVYKSPRNLSEFLSSL